MPIWTTHIRYTFHAEVNDRFMTADRLARFIEHETGLCTMVEPYVGSWRGEATDGLKVTWLAPCAFDMGDDEREARFSLLNDLIRDLTGNTCLMPVRDEVDVYCTCNE